MIRFIYLNQENDIVDLRQRLSECFKYLQDGSLKHDCENLKCTVPAKCLQYNAVYHILHFLVDNKFNVSFNWTFSIFMNELIKQIQF